MDILLGHFGRQSPASLLTRAFLTIILITVADYVTGPDLSLFIFYFFPIITVSWFLGKRQGIVMALSAGVAAALHDLLSMYSYSGAIPVDVLQYWGFLQRTGVFLIVSVIIAALRSSEDERRHDEYKLAHEVQSFLQNQPSPSLDHFSCFGFCKSYDHLTGDFFDLVRFAPTKLAIVVGDICGKGVSAALLMAYVQGVLRSHVLSEQKLGGLMSVVNRALYLSTAEDKFATLFIGIYDDESRTLTYVNAGHDPPAVLRCNGMAGGSVSASSGWTRRDTAQEPFTGPLPEIVKLKAGGLLLGVDPSAKYTVNAEKLHLGDILLCDTDGVKEARNEQGEMYGLGRMTSIVSAHREKSSVELHGLILEDIEKFVGMEPQFDDMTLVVGKVL